MKASDIPDTLILDYLSSHQGEWSMFFGGTPSTGLECLLKDYPPKVCRAKFKALIKRKLIGGCPCGCRGDFEITDKGLALINKPRTKPYTRIIK